MVVDPKSDVNIAAESICQLEAYHVVCSGTRSLCYINQVVEDTDLIRQMDPGWCGGWRVGGGGGLCL
jgi:hypothetical protein